MGKPLNEGVPPSGSGHSDEPASGLAAVAGSVPNAGQWAVLGNRWGYEAVRIETVTPKLIKHKRGFGRRLSQTPRSEIVALFEDEAAAKQLVQAIDGARDRFRKQRREEHTRHEAVMLRIGERQDAAIKRVVDGAIAKARGEQP